MSIKKFFANDTVSGIITIVLVVTVCALAMASREIPHTLVGFAGAAMGNYIRGRAQ